jgi:hypothetical protein
MQQSARKVPPGASFLARNGSSTGRERPASPGVAGPAEEGHNERDFSWGIELLVKQVCIFVCVRVCKREMLC